MSSEGLATAGLWETSPQVGALWSGKHGLRWTRDPDRCAPQGSVSPRLAAKIRMEDHAQPLNCAFWFVFPGILNGFAAECRAWKVQHAQSREEWNACHRYSYSSASSWSASISGNLPRSKKSTCVRLASAGSQESAVHLERVAAWLVATHD